MPRPMASGSQPRTDSAMAAAKMAMAAKALARWITSVLRLASGSTPSQVVAVSSRLSGPASSRTSPARISSLRTRSRKRSPCRETPISMTPWRSGRRMVWVERPTRREVSGTIASIRLICLPRSPPWVSPRTVVEAGGAKEGLDLLGVAFEDQGIFGAGLDLAGKAGQAAVVADKAEDGDVVLIGQRVEVGDQDAIGGFAFGDFGLGDVDVRRRRCRRCRGGSGIRRQPKSAT